MNPVLAPPRARLPLILTFGANPIDRYVIGQACLNLPVGVFTPRLRSLSHGAGRAQWWLFGPGKAGLKPAAVCPQEPKPGAIHVPTAEVAAFYDWLMRAVWRAAPALPRSSQIPASEKGLRVVVPEQRVRRPGGRSIDKVSPATVHRATCNLEPFAAPLS
jgi:hypothetical protein